MFQERIQNSIKLLDEVWGSRDAWRQKLELEYLLMNSCTECVLGQLYGDYDDAPFAITKNSQEYAFYIDSVTYHRYRAWAQERGLPEPKFMNDAYEELGKQWLAALKE